jgi:RNA polymerase sigma factor (sigma-70 family)
MLILEQVTPEGRTRTRRPPTKPLAPLDQERQALAAAHVPVALSVARQFVRRQPMDPDEARSVALSGLVEAASRYQDGRGMSFPSYVVLVVKCQLACAADQYFRRARRTVRFGEDNGEAQVHDDREPEPDQDVGTADTIARLRRLMKPKDFELLWRVYAEDGGQTSIAGEQNVSRQRVNQKVDRAVERARRLVRGVTKQ